MGKVTQQGVAHVANVDGDWIVVFPNGEMRAHASQIAATKDAERWFRTDAKKKKLKVGVGVIETDPNE